MSPASSEDLLVKRAVKGDAHAFGELYMAHLDAIYRYVYYRVGEPQEAEDLTEQVFLKAWEALPGYVNYGYPFTSWLYRIAHNVVVDHHRKQRTIALEAPEESEVYESVEYVTLERIIQLEESASLAKAVSKLPEDQQQVIILRFVQGLSHGEIARIMDKTEGACRMIQYRALAALNKMLSASRVNEDGRIAD